MFECRHHALLAHMTDKPLASAFFIRQVPATASSCLKLTLQARVIPGPDVAFGTFPSSLVFFENAHNSYLNNKSCPNNRSSSLTLAHNSVQRTRLTNTWKNWLTIFTSILWTCSQRQDAKESVEEFKKSTFKPHEHDSITFLKADGLSAFKNTVFWRIRKNYP